ncbi:MAG TPA: hypothetical protein VKJ45_29135 [Blastocatellia bacterium]|nr:hypothetical protein [Blastocatellia bacterium]
MESTVLHDDRFLTILWDDLSRIIGIDWKESTAAMTDDQMKEELALFAGYVETKKAAGILVDVTRFRHRMGPEFQQWRVQNISPRYSAAGVKRFAFLFPPDAEIPSAMNQSAAGEAFITRAFNNRNTAFAWLTEP